MENVTPQLNLKRLPMDVSGDPACQAYLTRGEVLLPPKMPEAQDRPRPWLRLQCSGCSTPPNLPAPKPSQPVPSEWVTSDLVSKQDG